MGGLNITEKEFTTMSATSQRLTLFKNSQHSIKLIDSYNFHKKVQYAWLSGLTIGIFFLIKYAILK